MASKWRAGGKTKKQWMDAGYKLKEEAQGFSWYYWTYYEPSEVEKMTDEEYEAHKAGIREYRNWLARERRRKEREALERVKQWELEEEQREQRAKERIRDIKAGDTKIALVAIPDIEIYPEGFYGESYIGTACYHYEVPASMHEGDIGIFPFGENLKQGTIRRFVDPEDLLEEYWFPDGLKMIQKS